MKVNKLILKLHKAIIRRNREKERKIWFKILKKSIKHKRTQAVN